jgi:peptide chain release factor 2
MQEIASRKAWIDSWTAVLRRLDDAGSLVELAEESNDESFTGDIDKELEALGQEMGDLEFRRMLSGEDDERNAILTIHAGAGGTEAQDWA